MGDKGLSLSILPGGPWIAMIDGDAQSVREVERELGPMARQRVHYNAKFLEFIKAFATIGADRRIFPKKCRTCGKEYSSFPEYIHGTAPVAHGLEGYTDSLDVHRTMQYRNCSCGSTLTITFTKDTYPLLERFWEMLGKESKEQEKPLREIVLEFREQCNRYMEDGEEAGIV
jgi:hypothetical protein